VISPAQKPSTDDNHRMTGERRVNCREIRLIDGASRRRRF